MTDHRFFIRSIVRHSDFVTKVSNVLFAKYEIVVPFEEEQEEMSKKAT